MERIHVLGAGKLAKVVGERLAERFGQRVVDWAERDAGFPAFVVHAGSGRQLPEAVAFCEASGSTLVELSTGTEAGMLEPTFPLVVCPNVAILLVKFLQMMAGGGGLFQGFKVSIEESHQASKTSLAGTAIELAKALGVPASEIVSIRDPEVQSGSLGIPTEHLPRHAYHRIQIKEGDAEVVFEARILGHEPYARGVVAILESLENRPLPPGRHDVVELAREGRI